MNPGPDQLKVQFGGIQSYPTDRDLPTERRYGAHISEITPREGFGTRNLHSSTFSTGNEYPGSALRPPWSRALVAASGLRLITIFGSAFSNGNTMFLKTPHSPVEMTRIARTDAVTDRKNNLQVHICAVQIFCDKIRYRINLQMRYKKE